MNTYDPRDRTTWPPFATPLRLRVISPAGVAGDVHTGTFCPPIINLKHARIRDPGETHRFDMMCEYFDTNDGLLVAGRDITFDHVEWETICPNS